MKEEEGGQGEEKMRGTRCARVAEGEEGGGEDDARAGGIKMRAGRRREVMMGVRVREVMLAFAHVVAG